MKKGISPVVAVVLLIAIAVIASVGVWYWVGAYTGKPSIGHGSQYSFVISECNGTHVLLRNTGGLLLSANATIYDSDGELAGQIAIGKVGGGISPGNVQYVEINDGSTPLLSGQYKIIDANYPEYSFTCS